MPRLNGRQGRTLLAVAWLAGLAAATVIGTEDRFWPVAPAGMFAFRATETRLLSLRGTTSDGASIELTAASFGLDATEFSARLLAVAGGGIGFDDGDVLVALAEDWNRRHARTPVVRVAVVGHRTLLDRDGRRVDAELLSVEVPTTERPS